MKMKANMRANNRHVAPRLPWMILLALTITCNIAHGQEQPTLFSPASNSISSISGYAFFDSNNDGSRDVSNTLEYGISDISVLLFNCNGERIETTETDGAGYYSFDNLALEGSGDGGQQGYYINPQPPSWYVFTDVWNGKADVDSAIDPSTGSSACFDSSSSSDDGEEVKSVDFGLNFYIPPVPGPVTLSAPSEPPTVAIALAPPDVAVLTGSPTLRPTADLTSGPTLTPTTPLPSRALSELPPKLPSQSPTIMASNITSLYPTSSRHPTSFPSLPPSRFGEEFGPTTTERLVMTIRGIEGFDPNDEAWGNQTSRYIEQHFNSNENAKLMLGVFDVQVDIVVTKTSSSSDTSVFKRRQRHLQDETDPKFVIVTYNQRSIYKTDDPEKFDDVYVATGPFMTRDGSEGYIDALKSLSPYYNDILSVGSVKVDPAPLGMDGQMRAAGGNNQDDSSDKTMIYIIGGAVGAAFLIAALGTIVYRRRSSSRRSQEPVGNRPPSSISEYDMGEDLESTSGCSETYETATTSSTRISSRRKSNSNSRSDDAAAIATIPENSTSNVSNMSRSDHSKSRYDDATALVTMPEDSTSNLSQLSRSGHSNSRFNDTTALVTMPDNSTSNISRAMTSAESALILHIIAPPGKLGVIIDDSPEGECHVCDIRDSCPIRSQIQLDDKIMSVDDEDVQTMSAMDVSMMLGQRRRNAQRKITVLREFIPQGYVI